MVASNLRPDERELGSYRANRTQGARAVGGRLLLTNQRLMFQPHGIDRGTGGQSGDCELTSITAVGCAERGKSPFDGSLGRRLKVEHHDGVDLFVVNKIAAAVSAVRAAVGLSTA